MGSKHRLPVSTSQLSDTYLIYQRLNVFASIVVSAFQIAAEGGQQTVDQLLPLGG